VLGGDRSGRARRPGRAPFAREVLSGGWLFAAWGQGTLAGAPIVGDPKQVEAALKSEPIAGLALWSVYHLSEFGVAGKVSDDGVHGLMRVRTLWANPDNLVAAAEEKILQLARGDTSAVNALAEVAKKFPGTPFARDVEAGAGGLMAPVAVVGVIAAVSIPAFVKYQRKSESTEARMMLMRMYSGATEHAMDAGAVPAASAGPTPPLGTCCQQGGTCQPNPAWWADEPWRSLKFSVDDPHRYSYEYKADGSGGFTVLAHGDLDCDGTYSTFSMKGAKDSPPGMPELTRENETE
jgi:type II secretory pathway pseudopilin PulG